MSTERELVLLKHSADIGKNYSVVYKNTMWMWMKKIARKEFWMQSDLQVFTSIKKKKKPKNFLPYGCNFFKEDNADPIKD